MTTNEQNRHDGLDEEIDDIIIKFTCEEYKCDNGITAWFTTTQKVNYKEMAQQIKSACFRARDKELLERIEKLAWEDNLDGLNNVKLVELDDIRAVFGISIKGEK